MPILASVLLLDAGYRGLDAPEVLAAFSHRSADGDFRRATTRSMDGDFIAPIADFFRLDFDTVNAHVDLYRPLRNIGEVYRSMQETDDDRQLHSPVDVLSPPADREAFSRRLKLLLDDRTGLRPKDYYSSSFDISFGEECDRLYSHDAMKTRDGQSAPLTVSLRRWIEGACLPREREALVVAFSVMARSHGATILPIHFDLMARDIGLRGLEERELMAIYGCIDCDRLSEVPLSAADCKGTEMLARDEYRALDEQRDKQPSLYWAFETTKENMPGKRFDRGQFLERFKAARVGGEYLEGQPTEQAERTTERDKPRKFLEEFLRDNAKDG